MGADKHPTTTPDNYNTEPETEEQLYEQPDLEGDSSYNTTSYAKSLIAYDGELIELGDGAYRHKKDNARQRYYDWAENRLDDEQMTFDDVKQRLEDR